MTLSDLSNSKAVFSAPSANGSGLVRVVTPYGEAVSTTPLVVAPPAIGLGNIATISALSAGGASQTAAVTQANKYGVFTFDATQDQYLSVQITSLTTTPTGNLDYSIYTPANAVLASGSVSALQKTIHVPRIPASGTYLIAFRRVSGTFEVTANLELNAQLTDAMPIAVSTTAVNQTKRAVFAATAGQSFGFAVTNLAFTPPTTLAVFDVFRPDGNWLSQLACNPSSQPGCQLSLRNLPTTGTYTVMIGPNAAVTMSFVLTLSQNFGGLLAINTPVSLNLEVPGRHALLSFTAAAGQTVALNANTIATVPANKPVQLTVFNPTGTQIASVGNSSSPTLNLPNLPAGTYTALINSVTASTATMQVLLASGMTGVLPTDGTSQAFAGTVPSQQGFFTFDATAGQSVGLAVAALVLTPASNLVEFAVRRPDGALLQSLLCNPASQPGCQWSLRNLPSSGTYSIVATPNAAVKMSFTLTLSQHLGGTFALDTPVNLTLGVPGRHALLSFTVSAGQTVALNARNIVTTPANKTVQLTVFNLAGAQIANVGNNSSPTLNLPNLAEGTYSALINTVDASTATLQATLASGVIGVLPTDGTTQTFATTVSSQQGFFTFSGTAGQNLGLGVTSLAVTPSNLVTFDVLRPDGIGFAQLFCNPSSQPGCQLNLRNLPTTGTYKVVATPWAAATMSFGLTLSQHVTATLALDTPHSLNLNVPGRHALLTFTANAGQTMALNANTIGTTPANKAIQLTVFNPGGGQIANVSNANDPTINLPNLAAGTYSALINTVDASTATLHVTLASGVTGLLPTDGTGQAFATMVKSQQGFFTFNATAGQSLGFAVTGLVLMPAANLVEFDVFRPDGGLLSQIFCNPSSQPGCQFNLRNLPATGTYKIVASPWAVVTMSFTLTLSLHVADTLVANTPYSLNLGVPGQYALLIFMLPATQTVTVNANAIVTTPANKAVQLTVFNPAGTQIANTSNTTNPTLNLPSLAAGTYSLLINTVDASTVTMQVNRQ